MQLSWKMVDQIWCVDQPLRSPLQPALHLLTSPNLLRNSSPQPMEHPLKAYLPEWSSRAAPMVLVQLSGGSFDWPGSDALCTLLHGHLQPQVKHHTSESDWSFIKRSSLGLETCLFCVKLSLVPMLACSTCILKEFVRKWSENGHTCAFSQWRNTQVFWCHMNSGSSSWFQIYAPMCIILLQPHE